MEEERRSASSFMKQREKIQKQMKKKNITYEDILKWTEDERRNIEYANKNNIDLFEFLNKTGKKMPKIDEYGNMIVDKDSRWLEE